MWQLESIWWHDRARCKGMPSSVFYPPEDIVGISRRHYEDAAKRICLECPVLDPCRNHAVAAQERFGIWGATTPYDRRQESRAGDNG
uniref:WhiB family transcriptional regulator n=1 Tax=Mycobacterium sp. OAE908 TaxID=2817899 RepID=UPI0034E28729